MSHQSSPPGTGLRVAFITMHTSSLERAGAADTGGVNVLIAMLARALERLGVRMDFLTRRTDLDQPEREDVVPLVTLRRLPANLPTPLPKSETDRHVDKFREAMEVLGPHDLIHPHHWMSGMAALPVARAWRVPHVMVFHSVVVHPDLPLRDGEPPESPVRVDGGAVCVERSDLVLCVSRHGATMVIDCREADPERARIVCPGANADLSYPATHPWAPPGICPGYVAFVARPQPLKAPDVAIRTMACLPGTTRPDLAVISETSADFTDHETELHALVGDLGLRRQVHSLLGQNRESLAHVARHASVMLVPSHFETSGLIALEASASGAPVLAAVPGGLTEAICSIHTDLLIPTHDPCIWAETLGALFANESRRKLLGATGEQRVLMMTWERAVENTLQQYRRILWKSSSSAPTPMMKPSSQVRWPPG